MDEQQIAPHDAAAPLVLTIDVGSSSVRTLVFDAAGRSVQGLEQHIHYALRTTADGAAEANPEVVLQYVGQCIDASVAACRSAGVEIDAVACDTFWHSLLGVDASGKALTPVFTWADTRSADEAKELQRRLPAGEVHQRTGAGLYANYLPAKLLWHSRSEPDTFRKVKWWMSFGEFLYLSLTGERIASISMASATGLFDQRRCVWDEGVVDALPIREEQLSPIADFHEALCDLRDEYRERWPQLHGKPWYLPLGDGACNNVGSGGVSPRWVVVMIGTSGAIRVVRATDRFRVPKGLWTYRVDRRRIVQGGALSAGGNVFAWLASTLKVSSDEELAAEVASVGPDAHGLTVLPFLAGERSPGWDADARCAIAGMTLSTTPADIARAALEGVSYRFGLVFKLLAQSLEGVDGIIGSGAGLLQSPVWMEIMTDVLGHPMSASTVPEATSRGAALLALEALGAIPDIGALPIPLGRCFRPDAGHTQLYAAASRRQEQLYQALPR